MNKQVVTSKGLQKRIKDLGLAQIKDPRKARKVKISLATIVTALVVSMTTQARSLRAVERRTEQMAAKHGTLMNIGQRIADNTFGKIIPRLRLACLVACIHRLIKAEHRRGTLKPQRFSAGVIAIDGKNAGTLHWHDLCRVLELEQSADVSEVRTLLTKCYPEAQLCVPTKGQPYALMRMHTVTLVSAAAAPCIHIRPIAGHTNEIGSMPALLTELKKAYGRTRLWKWITTDAGNTSLKTAAMTLEIGCEYFGQLKGDHDLHREAVRALETCTENEAAANYADKQNGNVVTYHVWQHDLGEGGWFGWTHARQLVRVQRVAEHPVTGKITIGNRYYVCSRTTKQTNAEQTLALSRLHWRCENEIHWTSDFEFLEDRRKLAWSRHPRGILIIAAVRMMALAILATARRLSSMKHNKEMPSWAQVAEHFFLLLCSTTVLMPDFDDV